MFSLHEIDEKMLKYIDYENGFFIECGANDGITQSNTAFLEKAKGWKGLLVEPGLENYKKCLVNRPNSIVENYALVSPNYKENTIKGNFGSPHFNGLMNSVDVIPEYFDDEMKANAEDFKTKFKTNPVETNCCTLQSLLDKHNIQKVDFFSLDTEGYELEILKGLNFSSVRPKYILIETTVSEHYTSLVNNFMSSVNYKHIERLSINDSLYMDEK